jgi:hypothetical protein
MEIVPPIPSELQVSELASWFRGANENWPCPTDAQLHPLLIQIRSLKRQHGGSRIKASIEAVEQRVKAENETVRAIAVLAESLPKLISQLEASGDPENTAAALADLLKAATVARGRLGAGVAGRPEEPWHAGARFLADYIHRAWASAGQTKISHQTPNGPLVKVIARCLAHIEGRSYDDGQSYDESTIAKALSRKPPRFADRTISSSGVSQT